MGSDISTEGGGEVDKGNDEGQGQKEDSDDHTTVSIASSLLSEDDFWSVFPESFRPSVLRMNDVTVRLLTIIIFRQVLLYSYICNYSFE